MCPYLGKITYIRLLQLFFLAIAPSGIGRAFTRLHLRANL